MTPQAYSDADLLALLAMRDAGMSQRAIAKKIGRTAASVSNALHAIDRDYRASLGTKQQRKAA